MKPELRWLDGQEIMRTTVVGATEPQLCRLSDNDLYIVKGKQALTFGLIAETVAATAGHQLGITVPSFAIVEFSRRMLQGHDRASRSLGVAPCFASKYIKGQPVSEADSARLNQEALRDLFVFDYWIRNGDRTGTMNGGNSNLLFDVEAQQLIVVDHNLAFDHEFSFEDHNSLHIARRAWHQRRDRLADMDNRIAKMDAAIKKVQAISGHLPQAWTEQCPTAVNDMLDTLNKVYDPTFWDLLR